MNRLFAISFALACAAGSSFASTSWSSNMNSSGIDYEFSVGFASTDIPDSSGFLDLPMFSQSIADTPVAESFDMMVTPAYGTVLDPGVATPDVFNTAAYSSFGTSSNPPGVDFSNVMMAETVTSNALIAAPEPATLALSGLGLIAIGTIRRRRRRR